MNNRTTMELRNLEDNDLALVSDWLRAPHVSVWYHDLDDWIHEITHRQQSFSFIRHFIIMLDGHAIGFCQYYPVAASQEECYKMYPQDGTYSIDYLIGDAGYLRKGLGSQIVRELCLRVFQLDDSQRIVVQPEAENAASCRSLLRAGFSLDETSQTFWITRESCKTPC